jgi:hypothetical protein
VPAPLKQFLCRCLCRNPALLACLAAWRRAHSPPLASLPAAHGCNAPASSSTHARYPNIEFSADIHVIGEQGGALIVELIADVENKGKAQHRMEEFNFDLNALLPQDPVLVDQRWGGQINFPHEICAGSFLPAHYKFFFIDPGTKAKYSYIARVPLEAAFLILHCRFEYAGRGKTGHTAEKTIKVSSAKPLP